MVCIYVELDAEEVWPASAWVGFAKDVWVTSTLVSQGVRLQPSPISSKDRHWNLERRTTCQSDGKITRPFSRYTHATG